jgi:hypothetical protein
MARITIGDVIQEWTPDEGEPNDLMAYVQVDATFDERPIKLGVLVGVPEWQQETCRAAGGYIWPFLSTWWADASDWQDLPSEFRQDAEEALSEVAPRLWRQAMKNRLEVRS